MAVSHALLGQWRSLRGHDSINRLPDLSLPILILHGNGDRIASYDLAKKMHAKLRNSEMVTFRGGHLLVFLKPKPFVDATLRFLRMPMRKDRAELRNIY